MQLSEAMMEEIGLYTEDKKKPRLKQISSQNGHFIVCAEVGLQLGQTGDKEPSWETGTIIQIKHPGSLDEGCGSGVGEVLRRWNCRIWWTIEYNR